jgi:hypothetical protein
MTATITQPLSEIRPEVLYPLAMFSKVSGLGRAAIRKARRDGLPIRYFSKTAFVLGQDFISHVVEHSTPTKPGFDDRGTPDRNVEA